MTREEDQRLVVDVPKRDARRLKAKLALRGESLTSWLRKVIKDFINSD